MSGRNALTVNEERFTPTFPVAGTPTNSNCVAADKTLNAALVPLVNDRPAVFVAVKVAPVPAEASVTPVTTIEFVPDTIVPETVPPIAPAFPFVDKVNVELAVTLVATPKASCA